MVAQHTGTGDPGPLDQSCGRDSCSPWEPEGRQPPYAAPKWGWTEPSRHTAMVQRWCTEWWLSVWETEGTELGLCLNQIKNLPWTSTVSYICAFVSVMPATWNSCLSSSPGQFPLIINMYPPHLTPSLPSFSGLPIAVARPRSTLYPPHSYNSPSSVGHLENI